MSVREENIYAQRDGERDIAVFRVNKTVYLNVLFHDNDTGLHDFITFEEYPFINIENLEPGTDIAKLGRTSGFTRGRLIGIAEVNAVENHVSCKIKGVAVQWYPGSRFCEGGDSGSIYYAVRGCFLYPIAVHRGTFSMSSRSFNPIITTVHELPEDNVKSTIVDRELIVENVSLGTPIFDELLAATNHFKTVTTWEKALR